MRACPPWNNSKGPAIKVLPMITGYLNRLPLIWVITIINTENLLITFHRVKRKFSTCRLSASPIKSNMEAILNDILSNLDPSSFHLTIGVHGH